MFLYFFTDIPAQVPPLTPGTNKKMTEALKASYATWDKELSRHNIPRGKYQLFLFPHYAFKSNQFTKIRVKVASALFWYR